MSQHKPVPAIGTTVRRRTDKPRGYCPLWEVKHVTDSRLYLERSPSHLYHQEELFLWAPAANFVELSRSELGEWLDAAEHLPAIVEVLE